MFKHKKKNPLFLAFVLLMLCLLTVMMVVSINAKYVLKSDPSVLYLTVVPLTYDCVLNTDVKVHNNIYNAQVPISESGTMAGSQVLAEIEILYFSSWERTSYTESGDGPTVEIPKSGADFKWSDGIDVGLTVGSVRFFYDAAAKTGYIISRRASSGSSPNIIQANDLSARLFSPIAANSWTNLREVYFLDYGGVFDVENPAQVSSSS